MKAAILIMFVCLMSLSLHGNSQCPAGETQVQFFQGIAIQARKCIQNSKVVAGCTQYDNATINGPIFRCTKCNGTLELISFKSEMEDQCVTSSQNDEPGCAVYTNKNDEQCIKCQKGLNTFILEKGDPNIVFCSSEALLIGDGVEYSTCEVYKDAKWFGNRLVQCKQCEIINGNQPTSKDCSVGCSGGKAAYFYLSGGVRTLDCRNLAKKSTCKTFTKFITVNCAQCAPGNHLVIANFILGNAAVCIPTKQIIPGCVFYFGFNIDHCIQCKIGESTGVELQFFKGYQTCASAVDQLIGACKTLGSDGISCNECFFGYNIDYELNRCVLRVNHCAEYDLNFGFCLGCIPRYILEGQTCIPVSNQCLKYDQFTGVCQGCIQKYAPSPNVIGQCIIDKSCPSGQFYNQQTKACQKGLIQSCHQYIVDGSECSQCLKDHQLSRFRDKCNKIIPPVQCPNETALHRYVIYDNECKRLSIFCKNRQYRFIEGSPNAYCYECVTGYYSKSQDGECIKIGG